MLATELSPLADLLDPAAYPHPVDRVEGLSTHISQLFLAGDFVYKLKRPVSLGFVDFSTLGRRRFYCEEELRLNRRLAPQLYLGVVAVVRVGDRIRIDGQGEVIDYAVRMRRFPQQALLTEYPLNEVLIDRLAERVARFHASLAPAPPNTPYGDPLAILAPMRDNFAPLRAALARCDDPQGVLSHRLQRLERWTQKRFAFLRPVIEQRRREGFIRECHGDMHRGNVVVLDGQPVIFDCIEFNASLRWIDTMSEVAFLTMDLAESGDSSFARRLLNGYLEVSGDYAGLRLLRFYQVYRALVRAKVCAIRILQADPAQTTRPSSPCGSTPSDAAGASSASPDGSSDPRECDPRAGDPSARAALCHYLALAQTCTGRHQPKLFITHGFSGSGKTWIGNRLREHLPIIQIRSDVERKRLCGVAPQGQPSVQQRAQLYTAEVSEQTYARLLALARELVEAGFSILVDATFLQYQQRAAFRVLAQRLNCPFRILVMQAPMHLLRERINARSHEGADASDADIDVLSLQIASREPLTDAEHQQAVFLNSEAPMQIEALLAHVAGDQGRRGSGGSPLRVGSHAGS
ncbi:MAG: AAA family ATPase [Lamprobacter sp.]|uniref:bifunctional aminoglycoside phosphotransferase/ATP-binding protein n=1 Tax=Lamprobacter sp. TaxID=3100796 RepID=UPI002B258927|nr:AAA family ATPase [Lamprobacter sp.]MEA3640293.1 AAA family ATPase [Lamprobacter sp.]